MHDQSFLCFHWFFIAGGPGWPTGPISRLLLCWSANIIMVKLKIKVISGIKLNSSVLGLPVQTRRPPTRTSQTPKQLWIFDLVAVFSGFCWCGSGHYTPSTLEGKAEEGGWVGKVSLLLAWQIQPQLRLITRTEASSRSRDRRLYSSGPEATTMTSAEKSAGFPWRHSSWGHFTPLESINSI